MTYPSRRTPTLERLEPRTLFSSAFPNVNISRMKGNQAEGSIAVDPLDPAKLVSVSNIDTGDGLMLATSSDGGASWSAKTIATDNGTLPPACCDPSLAFDSYGNLFLVYLNSTDTTVELLLSTDAGHSFTVLAQYSGNVDQPTVATGPGSVWLDFDKGNYVAVAGAPVVSLGSVGQFEPLQLMPGSAGGQFGDIAVNSSGQVMVTYQHDIAPHRSQVFINFDATGLGGKFSNAKFVTGTNVPTFDFVPAQSTRGIDAETGLAFDTSGGQFAGRLYLLYTDENPAASGNTDILVRYSDNNGVTWSNPIRVNDDTGVNTQMLPRISADPTTGKVAVSWYDARNDQGDGTAGDTDQILNDDVEFFATVITPATDGLFVSPNQQISAGVSNAFQANSTIDLGDYTGLSFYNGTLHPLWFDNSNSTGDNPNGKLNQLNAYTASAAASSFASATELSLGGLTTSSGPLATLTVGAGLNPGFIRAGRFYTITLTWAAGTDLSTINGSDLLITGLDGFSASPQLLRTRTYRTGVTQATYRISDSVGTWTPADIGTYSILLQPNSASDTSGASSEPGVLGDFVIATGLAAKIRAGGNGHRHHLRTAEN